jgi:hypothetical protein
MKDLPACGSFFGVQVRQFFPYIFPHMPVQIQLHTAEGTYEVGTLREVFHRERIFPAANRTGDSQLLLLHFGISLESMKAAQAGMRTFDCRLQVSGSGVTS